MANTLISKGQPKLLANPRLLAIEAMDQKENLVFGYSKAPSERFASRVFSRAVMQRMLPKEVFKNIVEVMDRQFNIMKQRVRSGLSLFLFWSNLVPLCIKVY